MTSILKRHGLRPATASSFDAAEATARVAGLRGVLSANWNGTELVIEYDLRLISLNRIEEVAVGAGVAFQSGWHRLRRDWWKFTEANELSNATRSGDGHAAIGHRHGGDVYLEKSWSMNSRKNRI
jgi:hypothetical protein